MSKLMCLRSRQYSLSPLLATNFEMMVNRFSSGISPDLVSLIIGYTDGYVREIKSERAYFDHDKEDQKKCERDRERKHNSYCRDPEPDGGCCEDYKADLPKQIVNSVSVAYAPKNWTGHEEGLLPARPKPVTYSLKEWSSPLESEEEEDELSYEPRRVTEIKLPEKESQPFNDAW